MPVEKAEVVAELIRNMLERIPVHFTVLMPGQRDRQAMMERIIIDLAIDHAAPETEGATCLKAPLVSTIAWLDGSPAVRFSTPVELMDGFAIVKHTIIVDFSQSDLAALEEERPQIPPPAPNFTTGGSAFGEPYKEGKGLVVDAILLITSRMHGKTLRLEEAQKYFQKRFCDIIGFRGRVRKIE